MENGNINNGAGSTPKKQLAVLDQTLLMRKAQELKIINFVDFKQVDIQTFIRNNPKFSAPNDTNEYGVVLVKNQPYPILLTNSSYFLAQYNFGMSDNLCYIHPPIAVNPFGKCEVVYSKVCHSYALSYDYLMEIGDLHPRNQGEIPSSLPRVFLERILQFLNYAVYGEPCAESSDYDHYDLMLMAIKLFNRYPQCGFLVQNDIAFDKKIQNAINSYAKVTPDETLLAMEDKTIFGSAKEGFVFTDKHIYIKEALTPMKSISIDDIVDVVTERRSGLVYIMLTTTKGEVELSYGSNEAQLQDAVLFIKELFQNLQKSINTVYKDSTLAMAGVAQILSQSKSDERTIEGCLEIPEGVKSINAVEEDDPLAYLDDIQF